MDKLTYASDTTAAVPGAKLTEAKFYFAATGNSTAGYFAGGRVSSSPQTRSTMDKTTYSSDTTAAVPGAALTLARYGFGSASPLENALPTGPVVPFDNSNPNTGYFTGGGPGGKSTTDKLSYASDTTAEVPGAALTAGRRYLSGTGSSTAGYFGGGHDTTAAPSAPVSLMDKLTYASDTTAAAPGANLTNARRMSAATGNTTHGYFGGGTSPGYVSTMDKTTYSSDTTAAVPGAALSGARGYIAATGNSDAGYFGGGYENPGNVSTMDKTTYSSDTTAAVPGAILSSARSLLAATGNSTHGYFAGGGPSPKFSTMDKTTYASDTTEAVPGAALSAPRRYLSATGNSTAGYFGGGQEDPATVSTTEKITYASDTTEAVPGAALSGSRLGLAAASARGNALPAGNSPVVV